MQSYEEKIKSAAGFISRCDNIVFFGGAGVSTGSGIPDFRGGSGLYNRSTWGGKSPEYHLSRECLKNEPEAFFDYYRKNMLYPDAVPDGAHKALAYLEKTGKLTAVVTQNIDGLHQAAGSRNVYELHGSVLRNHCVSCGRSYGTDFIMNSSGIPLCRGCGGTVRPDVVLYGEGLDDECFMKAASAIRGADLLIIGGTSLTVQPAASLAGCFRGSVIIIINKTPGPYDGYADLIFREDISDTLEKIVSILPDDGSMR